MDAQEMHDYEMSKRRADCELRQPIVDRESKAKLEEMLVRKNGPSKEPPRGSALDPTENAVRNNPGLTREAAVRDAENLGF